jgi:UDP:flavonoid glycosyltransferase YjiC (YdhE family)
MGDEGAGRSARILYVSGSIGLGHAARDVAIAKELRRLNQAAEIVFLAGDPARQLIAEAGETVLPESRGFGEESTIAEESADGFSLDLMSYGFRARKAMNRTVQTFEEINAKYPYDLLIGDETYEIFFAMGKKPELKKTPFTMIYDFVGIDVMSRNPLKHLMAYLGNRGWCGGRAQKPSPADLTIFIGEPEDVADRSFGVGLPNRRDFAVRNYEFVGYVFPFKPEAYADRTRLRASLGYDDRQLIICSIGGTAVGGDLLRLCADAYPFIREQVEDVRMVLVCGPRLQLASLGVPPGVELRQYVPRLHEHLAASDLAVVQGGGTTTLELTALRRPFIYFPLENHFEQNVVVAERLARHQAGRRLSYSHTTPQQLANVAAQMIGSEASWPAIPADGAAKAAALINRLLTRARSEEAGSRATVVN